MDPLYYDETCCLICGQGRDAHVGSAPVCLHTVEAIIRRCYTLVMAFSRPIVRALLMEEFPNTYPGFLLSVERGMTVDVPVHGFGTWNPNVLFNLPRNSLGE